MKIDTKSEALEFCKLNGIHPSVLPLSFIEKAIERGYSIAVDQLTSQVLGINEDLRKAQALSK